MWTLSCLVDDNQTFDIAGLEHYRFTVTAAPPVAPQRQLLAHVLVTEDNQHGDAYAALTVLALQLDHASRGGVTDLQPLLDVSMNEQHALRTWLMSRRWPAWARAAVSVRAQLGDPTPPVVLAEAARQWMLPLATLTSAVAQDRLPAIRSGDRQLIYSTTIAEAQERGLLHPHRGRPRRRNDA